MPGFDAQAPGRMWSLSLVVIIRLILYLVILGFFLQYLYYTQGGRIYRPDLAVAGLAAIFFINLGAILLSARSRFSEQLVALTYVLDIGIITYVTLVSGGFNSILLPIYLPTLVMAAAWLPRRFTAVFPSIATFGIACIGYAHLTRLLDEDKLKPFDHEIMESLRIIPYHTVVTTMLILAVLFFVVSYLSGMLSDRIFVVQRLNAAILAGMNEGVAVVDRKGMMVYVNSEFSRLFPGAGPRGDFFSVADRLFPSGDTMNLERLWELEAGGKLRQRRELPGEGGRPPLEVKVSGVRLRRGAEPYGLLFLVADLTLRKRMEKAERGLERTSAISTMAAGLAHEIRNPLAALRSAIQEIGRSFPDDSQNRILTDIVISESDRLDGIIGRFLDFSREGRLRLGKTRLGNMAKNVATMLLQERGGDNLHVEVSVESDPEVTCDADRIMQVFVNLGLNASQALGKSGGMVEITVREDDRNGVPGVEILFADNGPGLSREAQKRIFEPFYSERQGGTGMGLSFSRREVALHGGEIEGENMPECGACFRVWLPLRQPDAGAEAARGATRRFHDTKVMKAQRRGGAES